MLRNLSTVPLAVRRPTYVTPREVSVTVGAAAAEAVGERMEVDLAVEAAAAVGDVEVDGLLDVLGELVLVVAAGADEVFARPEEEEEEAFTGLAWSLVLHATVPATRTWRSVCFQNMFAI